MVAVAHWRTLAQLRAHLCVAVMSPGTDQATGGSEVQAHRLGQLLEHGKETEEVQAAGPSGAQPGANFPWRG